MSMSWADARTIEKYAKELSEALRERFQGLDADIKRLEARIDEQQREIDRLKREPRQSLAQKLRERKA